MTPLHRFVLLLAGLVLAVSGGVTMGLTGAAAAPRPAIHMPPGPQPHGINIVFHSKVDPNFCVEDTPAPFTPASATSISACAVRDAQHWTLVDAADGSLVIVGGNTDNCLDFSAKVGAYVSMKPCTFQGAERFFFTPGGQIESTSGKKCLQAAQAKQASYMFINKCQSGVSLQDWTLSR